MSFPTHDRRTDEKLGEKLGLILSRVGSVRLRLNSLALQHAMFYTLAIVSAAAIADDRAELKGRLSTIVALANKPNPGTLWSYLVEDTLGYRDEFAPARI